MLEIKSGWMTVESEQPTSIMPPPRLQDDDVGTTYFVEMFSDLDL